MDPSSLTEENLEKARLNAPTMCSCWSSHPVPRRQAHLAAEVGARAMTRCLTNVGAAQGVGDSWDGPDGGAMRRWGPWWNVEGGGPGGGPGGGSLGRPGRVGACSLVCLFN